MSNMYHEIEKEVSELAKSLEITDSCEIREIICEKIQDRIQKMAEDVVDSLNTMGGDVQEAVRKGFLAGINHSHRYLQNEFWLSMLEIIREYGKSEHYDARNSQAVQMCARMSAAGDRWGENPR